MLISTRKTNTSKPKKNLIVNYFANILKHVDPRRLEPCSFMYNRSELLQTRSVSSMFFSNSSLLFLHAPCCYRCVPGLIMSRDVVATLALLSAPCLHRKYPCRLRITSCLFITRSGFLRHGTRMMSPGCTVPIGVQSGSVGQGLFSRSPLFCADHSFSTLS